ANAAHRRYRHHSSEDSRSARNQDCPTMTHVTHALRTCVRCVIPPCRKRPEALNQPRSLPDHCRGRTMHRDEVERLARMPKYYCSKHEAERGWRAKVADYGGYIWGLLMAAIQIGMIVRRTGSSPNTHAFRERNRCLIAVILAPTVTHKISEFLAPRVSRLAGACARRL